MERKCPNCGKALPEEAAFCLFCFTDIESFKKSEVRPVAATGRNGSCFNAFFGIFKVKLTKKFFCRIGICAAFLLVMGICIFAMKTINSPNALKADTGTTILKDTSAVAVTKDNGEAVTDSNGEQVFNVVEVTKVVTVSTTEKQGFFDKIFNSSSTEKNNNADKNNSLTPVETTKKESLFDKLFGDDDDETQPVMKPSTTQPATEASTETKPSTTAGSTEALPPATQDTATPTTPETTAESTPSETPISDFEYKLSEKYAAINKYNGTASHVTIPAVIEGKYVTEINQNVFQNNPHVVTVTFADDSKRPYLWIKSHVFTGCENLRTINLPDTDLGIYNHFAYNCPSVEKITTKNNQWRVDGGGLYYSGSKGWVMRYYCPASPTTSLKLPDWSNGIESACNLDDAINLKEIIYHKNAKFLPHQSIIPPNLENIFVDDNNPYAYDIAGIAFSQGNDSNSCSYPPQNKTTELTLPENIVFYGQYVKNSYLKTLYIPKTALTMSPSDVVNGSCFKNLENVHIQDGHPNQKTLVNDARVENIYIYE